MGTTLTGTTPQDTYDSLIKVTDNGPLSGTAKYLSDGLGNDSALALSTGNIGIGTTSPSQPLVVFKSTAADDIGQIIQQGANGTAAFLNIVGNNDAGASFNRITSSTSGGTAHWQIGGGGTASTMVLLTGGSERMRITSAGNVGIGTSAPQQKLQIGGNGGSFAATAAISFTDNNSGSSRNWAIANGASASGIDQIGALTISRSNALGGDALAAGTEIARFSANGLSFNGDTAAANALDDYEEGTWTMGVSFGGASVGVTTSANGGTYTKIGRQVTVNGFIQLTSKGSSSGNVKITGLPFSIPNSVPNYSALSIWFDEITFLGQLLGYGNINETTIDLVQTTELGVSGAITNTNFSNSTRIMVSLTYFV
jgi:hypothetical protein